MEIPEAINELTLFYNGYKSRPDPKLLKAAKLGIEALGRVQLYRKGMYTGLGDKLPGETERRDDDNSTIHRAENLRGNQ